MSLRPDEAMRQIDEQLAHVWMVRAFLKHSEEAEEDDELAAIHRELYDYMLALGGPLLAGDADQYLRLARKKQGKLQKATEDFTAIQPQISVHTNFQMAVRSLNTAVLAIKTLLANIG
jgi:cob(I)alamin adenosyltransferase